ncbi:hypothetical protein RHECNPAF_13300173 [Rhizobium etli CNPAF512]|nr:hypothetical protein RHECNPAF_13300173 [Rhizobium etli CNPAF512]
MNSCSHNASAKAICQRNMIKICASLRIATARHLKPIQWYCRGFPSHYGARGRA